MMSDTVDFLIHFLPVLNDTMMTVFNQVTNEEFLDLTVNMV